MARTGPAGVTWLPRTVTLTSSTHNCFEDMGSVDMGNPNTLRDFITWGQRTVPGGPLLPGALGPWLRLAVKGGWHAHPEHLL